MFARHIRQTAHPLLALLATGAAWSLAAAPAVAAERPATIAVSAPHRVAVGEPITVLLRAPAGRVRGFEAWLTAGGARYAGAIVPGGGRPLGPAQGGGGVAFGAFGCAQAGCGAARARFLPARPGTVTIRITGVRAVDAAGRPLAARASETVIRVRVGAGGGAHAARAHALRPVAAAPARPADATGDGRLDAADVDEVALAWATAREAGDPCVRSARRGDLDGDGCVTVADAQRALVAVRAARGSRDAAPALRAAPVVPGPIVVDSTGDEPDAAPGDGLCASAADMCTLRAAITEANAHAGADAIHFDIPGPGVHTIRIASALPTISDRTGATTIDGYTQPGASPNTAALGSNARLLVEVRGGGVNVGLIALSVTSAGNTIRGLAVYDVRPIMVTGSAAVGNVIAGSFVGTDARAMFGATTQVRNAGGIVVARGASGTVVGGTAPADRNVVSGNAFTGVYVTDVGTRDTVVHGNVVGLSPDGNRRIRNLRMGVDVNLGARSTVVGGFAPGQANVISGNTGGGVEVSHMTETQDNVVRGNLIGTNLAGTATPSWTHNSEEGVHVEDGVQRTLVEGNVIGDNYFGGVVVAGGLTRGTVVRGNWIGEAPAGGAMGNGIAGVAVVDRASGTLVADNLIARNLGPGVLVDGEETDGVTITRNRIRGNAGAGIDLAPLGADAADAGDADAGANDGLDRPLLAAVAATSASGTACAGCTVELFAADGGPDAAGSGAGFLGAAVAGADGRFTVGGLALDPGAIVTATATDAGGNTSEFARNAVRADAPPPPPPSSAADLFGREVGGGWGVADAGGTWSITGPAADFAVAGGAGAVALPLASGTVHEASLDEVALGDTDVVARVSVDRLAAGSNLYAWIAGRRAPGGREYRARLRFGPNGAVYVGIANAAGAAETFPAGEVNTRLGYAAGTELMVRLQLLGSAPTLVRARIWRAGTPEPATWNQSFTDATAALQGAGAVAIGARRSAGETGGAATIRVDDLAASAPAAP